MIPLVQEAPVIVKLAQTPAGWQLTRAGKPYVIRGAGGSHYLEQLAAAGGNSIRSWGADEAGGMLDRCQSLGLTLTLGIWLGHKEHGFSYLDPKARLSQLDSIAGSVARYRKHPALLVWALGNEMEVGLNDTESEALWKHIEEAAQYVHTTDPNHPVMTVVAEISEAKIAAIQRWAPSVDILGINAYGGAASLPERLKKAGWTKPFVITEFGPLGPWEVGKTEWGAAREATSSEKAKRYGETYQKAVASQKGQCLGSYVFLWDDKVEATPTWFGMFLPRTGEKLGPVDALTQAWSGKPPANRCPELVGLSCSADSKTIKPGESLTATVQAKDPEGDPLTVRYELRRENNQWLTDLAGAVGKPFTLAAPKEPGAYRLFVYVRDGKGGAATANVPFQVK